MVDYSKRGQKEYLENTLPPDILKVLMESKTSYTNMMKLIECTLFDKLQSASYKSAYIEKAVLLDEETAGRIAESVLAHSRGDKSTTFIDGEGGLCQVAAAVAQYDKFKEVCVLEKDMCMSNLHDHAKSTYLDPNIPIYDVNISMAVAEGLDERLTFVPPLLQYLPPGKLTEEVPSWTLVTTASQAVVKYLTLKMLYRENPFGEMYSSRPEFFLIVTARTYFHICCGISSLEPEYQRITEEVMREKRKQQVVKMASQTIKLNVIFQVFFDFCLVDVLPRKSYFPWKKHRSFNGITPSSDRQTSGNVYEEHHDSLMMIYVRPKAIEGLDFGKPFYLEHFFVRILKSKSKKIVELFEEWSTGWGFAAVEAGYTVLSEVKDVEDVEEFLKLYKLISALPDFERSNFAAEAIENYKTNFEHCEVDERAMEEFRIKFRKEHGNMKDVYGDTDDEMMH